MLIRRTRALFAVSLTFALLQLAAATLGGARVHSTRSWMPLQPKSQAAEHAARTGVVAPDDRHIPATPFLASAAPTLDAPTRASTSPVSSTPAIGVTTLLGQRFARAPPTRS